MPRAKGHDLCEIFGYTSDDRSDAARKQWKRQDCPFVGGVCIKHSHPDKDGNYVVYGSCSVVNKTRSGPEEVILCPQRLYANNYECLKACIRDAANSNFPIFLAEEYSQRKKTDTLPNDFCVMLGRNSDREISLSSGTLGAKLSLDWVLVRVVNQEVALVIPCEVQSIDTTGNYHANWRAYAEERDEIPNSKHGMNWANVWKRLIPQLIMKSSVASASSLCKRGIYFVLPDRVYVQFERLIGIVPNVEAVGRGVMTVMTYEIGSTTPFGQIRPLEHKRTVRMSSEEFAKAFASGQELLPLGAQLDKKVIDVLGRL